MKAVITVIGKDKVGIIASVSTYLAENSVNILDISQTIMQDEYFTMVMMVELSENQTVESVNQKLSVVAEKLGVDIRIQHEDIFNSMHRI